MTPPEFGALTADAWLAEQQEHERIVNTILRAEGLNEVVEEDDDADDWNPDIDPDTGDTVNARDRRKSVVEIRDLAKRQPHVKRALALYKSYVLGKGFDIGVVVRNSKDPVTDKQQAVIQEAKLAWGEFLEHNYRWWTVKEFGCRVWRDGEQFTMRVESDALWPPEVRFVDSEEIDEPPEDPQFEGTQGIVTARNDVATVLEYLRVDSRDKQLVDRIPAERMWHSKINADANVKRGISHFYPVRWAANNIPYFLQTEFRHRTLQASIVMQRKLKGSPASVLSTLDNLKTSTTKYPERDVRREKIRPGSIINTNQGVEIDFKQPESNFSDASPLAKMMILQISAATGWPYFMLSGDSSDSNFASSLVQESPVVLMVEEERDFFRHELMPIWKWVMQRAIAAKQIKTSERRFFLDYRPEFKYPPLVTRDRLKEAQADNILRMTKAISRQEMSRRHLVDPDHMLREMKEDQDEEVVQTPMDAMNQQQDQKAANAPENEGDGQNQGDGEPIEHDDSQT